MGAAHEDAGDSQAASVEAIDDASLVARALAGELKAEEQLYRRHAKSVFRTVTRVLGDRSVVPDVVQDTFLHAFNKLDQLRDPAKLRSWLLGIAVQRARKIIRRRVLERSVGLDRTTEDAALHTMAPTTWSPEARAQLAMIDDVLKTLPADDRIAWILRYVDGRSFEECAEICHTSISTVRRRAVSAHEIIQQRVRFREGGFDE